jgi:hypothetical protein
MFLNPIVKVEIESEGEINGFFTIHYKDGSIRSGWSCDQGSIEMDDGEGIDQSISTGLMDLWFGMDIPEEDNDHRFFSTWTPEKGLSPTTEELLEG